MKVAQEYGGKIKLQNTVMFYFQACIFQMAMHHYFFPMASVKEVLHTLTCDVAFGCLYVLRYYWHTDLVLNCENIHFI